MGKLRPPIWYLNTDLRLQSRGNLLPLVRALERGGMYRLHVENSKTGDNWACLELEKRSRTPDGDIKSMLKLIENLSPAARRIWDQCHLREMNPGYDSGFSPACGRFNHNIPVRTLRRMSDANLSLRITIYPPDEDGPPADLSTRAQRAR